MPALCIRSVLKFQRKMSITGLLSTRNLFWKMDCKTNQLRFGTATNLVSIFKAKLAKFWDCHTSTVTSTKEHITVLPCFNATGQFIPPFILFSGKRAPVGYNPLEGAVLGSAFAVTEKGYMDAPTFYLWLANHFIPHLPPARPVVLLVDSAEVHIDFHTFELEKKNNIYIFALLKNTTHLLQQAHVGLFGEEVYSAEP